LARPVSYINYTVNATDGNQHNVSVFLGASSNIARNNTTQLMQANKYTSNELSILKAGTAVQNILVTNNNLINWGFMYVAAPQSSNPVQFFSQEIPPDVPFIASADTTTTTQSTDLLLNTILPFGAVGASPVHKYIEIGYDDLYPIQYFGTNLLPYWKTTGNTIEDELTRADTASASIFKRCNTFDADLYNDAQKAGGTNYAKLCALAYRQSISAHVMTKDPQGNLLFLSKENSSGGFVTTVDVAYPSSPLFLFYNPVLIEGLLNGVFYYCESGKWTAPFAPHDIGHYPLVTGQGYFGNMPVEESGNMILMVAAMERAEGNSDYAKLHWPTITKWANYLNGVGYNPPNQLTSDDFAGVIASSVNLSAKLINGVAAYAGLAKAMGDTSTFNTYYSSAQQMAASWVANGDAGTNSLLAFNQPGTWSQTYNIIWDKMLGLKLFPQSVYDKNVKFYKSQLNAYGLPLDDRQTYTKGDWSMFTAIMASADSDFKALTDPIYAFATQTPNRYPLTDFYYTLTPTRDEFDARSVVGAFFIKMLERKWSLNTICTTPANLATNNITTSSAILNWAQSASAENYIFQGKAADSTNWRNFTLYALDSTYAFTGLRPKTTYQWRIASVCQSYPPVASEYSATQTFTTLSIPDSVKTGGALTITLSPNPAMDIATLHIANASGTVAVQLTNMVGIVMWKSGNSSYSNINIPINNIGSGVYIVTVKNNGQVRSLRLIKN
jgi:hypothetical protein